MKHLLKIGLLMIALSGCNGSKPKPIGKLVVTNSSPRDVEVIRIRDIGDTSASGIITSGSKHEAFFASATAPVTCTIEWRILKPKGPIRKSIISLSHLEGSRLGGYELELNGSLTWKVSPVPYPRAAKPKP